MREELLILLILFIQAAIPLMYIKHETESRRSKANTADLGKTRLPFFTSIDS